MFMSCTTYGTRISSLSLLSALSHLVRCFPTQCYVQRIGCGVRYILMDLGALICFDPKTKLSENDLERTIFTMIIHTIFHSFRQRSAKKLISIYLANKYGKFGEIGPFFEFTTIYKCA